MEDIFIKFFNPYSELDISFAKNIFTQPFWHSVTIVTLDQRETKGCEYNCRNSCSNSSSQPHSKQLMHVANSNLERPHVSVVLIEHGMSIEY